MSQNHFSNDIQSTLIAPLLRQPVERFVLKNGCTVILKPDRSCPVSSVQVWVKTGSIHEGDFLGSGLSHFVEHMLFKGTERRAGREISAEVQSKGGYINAYTTFDRTVYYIDLPCEHTVTAVDVLADAVLHSTLPADEVSRERDVILREIDMGLDEPDHQLSQALFETAFREHPYRYPIIGHREVFERVSAEDLSAYYRRRYVPNNLTVVIVGDFDPAAVKAAVEEHFGSAPRARLAPVFLPTEPGQLASRRRDLYEDVQITRAALGFQVPGLTHPDTPVLDLLSMILGHGDSSILWQSLREEKQLVHAVDAVNWTPGTVGLFYISLVCDPDKRDRALDTLRDEIGKVAAEGIKPESLDRAIRQALVGEVNVRKTMSGQASRLGLAEVVVGDLDYPANYLKRISSVSPDDIRRVAETYLVSERLTTVTMNPDDRSGETFTSSAATASSPDFEEIKRPNGARLLLRENRGLPNLHLRIVFRGGCLFEKPEERGITSLLATLLTKDNERRSAAEVAGAIESVGGYLREFCGNNSFGLGVEVLPSDLDLGLEVFRDAVVYPKFLDTAVSLEKESQIAEIKEDADDIVTEGRKRLRKLFFGDYPFAVESQGTAETVATITAERLRAFHRELVVSGNAVVAVSGDFNRSELEPKLIEFLDALPAGMCPKERPDFGGVASVGAFSHAMDRQQAVVFQAFPGAGLRAKDFYVSDVADELFSGMSSHLFERVREEKGLAYFVRSNRIIGLETAMFYFVSGTSPDRYEEVIGELDAEVARVQSGGVTEAELKRCQARLKAARRMSMQSNGACAAQAALNATYGLPVNDWRNYDDYIDAVSLDDIRDFARRHFTMEKRVQLVVGPVGQPVSTLSGD